MLLSALALLGVFFAGWAFGRARPAVQLPALIMTLFAAVTAHSGMQWAFLEGRLDQVTGDPRTDAPSVVIILIAAGEAVGLWLPFLLIPWAQPRARVWGAVYALAAATFAAAYFYFPFDLVVLSNELIAPDGPPYLFAAIVCLPLAALGYLFGWMKAKSEPLVLD